MNHFVCTKPICLSGRQFALGELIPDGYVLPKRAFSLAKNGCISEIEGGLLNVATKALELEQIQSTSTTFKVPITMNVSNMELQMDLNSILKVLSLLQSNPDVAVKEIETIENEDILILLNATDSRKRIQVATKERGLKLHEKDTSQERNDS